MTEKFPGVDRRGRGPRQADSRRRHDDSGIPMGLGSLAGQERPPAVLPVMAADKEATDEEPQEEERCAHSSGEVTASLGPL